MKDMTAKPKLEPFYQFKLIHNSKKQKDKWRMGQRFCNMYLQVANPELFYAHDIDAAIMIMDYLDKNCYTTELPPLVKWEEVL